VAPFSPPPSGATLQFVKSERKEAHMSTKEAFGTEKKTVATLGGLSVLLTLVLAAFPLVISPVFLA
jgi:hypothetical protein